MSYFGHVRRKLNQPLYNFSKDLWFKEPIVGTLDEAVRKHVLDCRVLKNVVSNRGEGKSLTHKGDPE